RREQILCAPWDAVQRSVVAARFEVAVGLARLREGEFLRQSGDGVQWTAVTLEPSEIHPGEIGRHDPSAFDERCEHGDWLERELFNTRGDPDGRWTGDGEPRVRRGAP